MSSSLYTHNHCNQFQLPWRTGIPLYNRIGTMYHKLSGQPVLDAEVLMTKAEKKTGLSQWGNLDIREPLHRIVEDYQRDHQLTPFGYIYLGELLLLFLCNRLRIQDKLTRTPNILNQEIKRPVFVIGMPRSGTTLLYNLMALNPALRALKVWETTDPVNGKEPKIWQKRIYSFIQDFYLPTLKNIHPRSPLDIEECTWLMANTFYTPIFSLFGSATNYTSWLLNLPTTTIQSAYQLYKAQLQILQFGQPAQQWLLKSPIHASQLTTLFNTFPDARVILPIRSMEQVIPSTMSLFATMRSISNWPAHSSCRDVLSEICNIQKALLTTINKFPNSIMLINFHDLVTDKQDTMKRIYTWLDIPTPTHLAKLIDDYLSQDKHIKGGHSYSLEQFGITTKDIENHCDTIAWNTLLARSRVASKPSVD